MTTTTTMTRPRIAADRVGDGEPAVLYLPGWCDFRRQFHDVLRLTGATRTAVSLDWRGHGASEDPAGDFGSADLVEDALEVIERLGLDRVVPVGQAHAGWVAVELRRRLGAERVPAVVLMDWMVLGTPPGFLDALAGLQDPEAWTSVRDALVGLWTTGVDSPAVLEHVAAMARHDFTQWARAGREISHDFASHATPLAELEALGCPALHLYAQPDDPGFLAAQQEHAATHPEFSVVRLRASSHFPALEVPDQVAAAIEEYVARW